MKLTKTLLASILAITSATAFSATNYEIRMPSGSAAATEDVSVSSSSATTLVAGSNRSYLIDSSGKLSSIGDNAYGQLGSPIALGSYSPDWVDTGLTGVSSVSSTGNHAIALMGDGTLKAVGYNGNGQLAQAIDGGAAGPHAVWTDMGLTGVVSAQAGGNHSVALLDDGTIRLVGYNRYGQLANTAHNSTNDATAAWVDGGLSGVKQVVAGGAVTLAVMTDGTLKGVGYNRYGSLGVATNAGSVSPNPSWLTVLTGVQSVSAGNIHTVVTMNDGSAKIAGYNRYGQIGTATNVGTTTGVYTWTDVTLTDIKDIKAGGSHTVALLNDGTLKAIGFNLYGQLGTAANSGSTSATYTWVDMGLTGVQSFSIGNDHTLALLNDGSVKAVGRNSAGHLMNPANIGTTTPNPTWLDATLPE